MKYENIRYKEKILKDSRVKTKKYIVLKVFSIRKALVF